MESIIIDRRFCGPPNSGNGGYVCGRLARQIEGAAEITLRAPPPLERPLSIVKGSDGAVELRENAMLLATGRGVQLETPAIPAVTFSEAEDAARRTPFDERNHKLPMCFVCGPARRHGDGLRIFAGPLRRHDDDKPATFASHWSPHPNLAGDDGLVAPEYIWAALDCPTGFSFAGAHHLGLNGEDTILLGRMSARVDKRPRPGAPCVILAWPTGRDGRKLFADGALLGADGELLAICRTTWLVVDRAVQLGERRR